MQSLNKVTTLNHKSQQFLHPDGEHRKGQEMSWKGREEERKGHTGQKTASADPTLVHGVHPNEEGWDKTRLHTQAFCSCSCKLRQFGFIWPTKMILILFPAFYYKHFLPIFYGELLKYIRKLKAK